MQAVRDALADITDADLDRPAPDGGWTARDVAHHLPDSETNGYIRLRRLIAEDDPVIVAYDQDDYARRLHYDRPIASSLAVLAAVRASSLELLEALTPEEWARSGQHSDSGRYSVDDWLADLCPASPRSRSPDPARPRLGTAAGGPRTGRCSSSRKARARPSCCSMRRSPTAGPGMRSCHC